MQYYLLRKKQLESGITDSIARFLIPNLAKIESKAYAPGMQTSHLAFIQTLLHENFQLWLDGICEHPVAEVYMCTCVVDIQHSLDTLLSGEVLLEDKFKGLDCTVSMYFGCSDGAVSLYFGSF